MVDACISSDGDDAVPAIDRALNPGVNMNVDSSAGSEVSAAELPRRLEVVAS
jgi:hypothetical protein